MPVETEGSAECGTSQPWRVAAEKKDRKKVKVLEPTSHSAALEARIAGAWSLVQVDGLLSVAQAPGVRWAVDAVALAMHALVTKESDCRCG